MRVILLLALLAAGSSQFAPRSASSEDCTGACATAKAAVVAGTTAVAVLSGVLVGVGLIVLFLLRSASAGSGISLFTANVNFAFRVNVLRIIIGFAGIISSYAYYSSTLAFLGGITALWAIRNHKDAQSRDYAIYATNTGICGVIFGLTDLLVFSFASSRANTYLFNFYFFVDNSGVFPAYAADSVTYALCCLVLSLAFVAVFHETATQFGSDVEDGVVEVIPVPLKFTRPDEAAALGDVYFQFEDEQPKPLLRA